MKAGCGIEILNPYEWLPGHGETAVKTRTEGADLVVAVTYDCGTQICVRELRFISVCSFYLQAFPGPSILKVERVEAELLLRGVLAEYPDSEAAMVWKQHFKYPRVIRHYSVAFLAANILLDVLASGVSLSESAS